MDCFSIGLCSGHWTSMGQSREVLGRYWPSVIGVVLLYRSLGFLGVSWSRIHAWMEESKTIVSFFFIQLKVAVSAIGPVSDASDEWAPDAAGRPCHLRFLYLRTRQSQKCERWEGNVEISRDEDWHGGEAPGRTREEATGAGRSRHYTGRSYCAWFRELRARCSTLAYRRPFSYPPLSIGMKNMSLATCYTGSKRVVHVCCDRLTEFGGSSSRRRDGEELSWCTPEWNCRWSGVEGPKPVRLMNWCGSEPRSHCPSMGLERQKRPANRGLRWLWHPSQYWNAPVETMNEWMDGLLPVMHRMRTTHTRTTLSTAGNDDAVGQRSSFPPSLVGTTCRKTNQHWVCGWQSFFAFVWTIGPFKISLNPSKRVS